MPEARYEKSPACFEFEAALPAYLEGETLPEVTAHARQCQFCSPVLTDLALIQRASHELPLEEPPARLWANLRAQLLAEELIHEPVSGWRRWFEGLGFFGDPAPVAALAGLVILASLLVLPRTTLEPTGATLVSNAAHGASDLGTPESPDEQLLASAVREEETNFRAQETSLEPVVKATYRKSLESLDNSIRECKDSIRREPTNRLAREYLLAAYTQKAQVLETALEYNGR